MKKCRLTRGWLPVAGCGLLVNALIAAAAPPTPSPLASTAPAKRDAATRPAVELRADAPQWLRDKLAAIQASARSDLAQARADLADAKKGVIDWQTATQRRLRGVMHYHDKATKDAAMQGFLERIHELQKQIDAPWTAMLDYGTMAMPIAIGNVGVIDRAKVVEVISPHELIATITTRGEDLRGRPGRYYTVQVDRDSEEVDLAGFDTAGFVDGHPIEPEGVFVVSGTCQFDMGAGGNRTICRIEPFDLGRYLEKTPR